MTIYLEPFMRWLQKEDAEMAKLREMWEWMNGRRWIVGCSRRSRYSHLLFAFDFDSAFALVLPLLVSLLFPASIRAEA